MNNHLFLITEKQCIEYTFFGFQIQQKCLFLCKMVDNHKLFPLCLTILLRVLLVVHNFHLSMLNQKHCNADMVPYLALDDLCSYTMLIVFLFDIAPHKHYNCKNYAHSMDFHQEIDNFVVLHLVILFPDHFLYFLSICNAWKL